MHTLVLEEQTRNGGREILPGNDHNHDHAPRHKNNNDDALPLNTEVTAEEVEGDNSEDSFIEKHKIRRKSAPPSLRPSCADTSPDCLQWASDGQCRTNPSYMFSNCLSSCGGCDITYKHAIPHSIELRYGQKMPTLGFGTAGLGGRTKEIVEMALKEGYRKIDSAQAREWYREDLVGAALRASSVPRDQIFITTKVHPRDLGPHATKAAIEKSLKELKTNYLNLVLLHYPECFGDLCQGTLPEGTWEER